MIHLQIEYSLINCHSLSEFEFLLFLFISFCNDSIRMLLDCTIFKSYSSDKELILFYYLSFTISSFRFISNIFSSTIPSIVKPGIELLLSHTSISSSSVVVSPAVVDSCDPIASLNKASSFLA